VKKNNGPGPPRIDEIDATILRMLLVDARTSLKDIAESCGVSSNAIHKRIKKLRSECIIIGSVTLFNPRYLGGSFTTSMELLTDYKQKTNVRETLQKHPRVIMCYEGVGRCDIFAIISVGTMEEMESMRKDIRNLPGVKKLVMSVRVDDFKFSYENLDLKNVEARING
jgi:DNA-binding Lrp family transcriptional regulator